MRFHFREHVFRFTFLAFGLALWAGFSAEASRAEDDAEPGAVPVTGGEVRQLFVPADRPKDWPAGNWEVITTEEYRRLLEGLKPEPVQPAGVTIRTARYQAVFTGERLTRGRLDLKIKKAGEGRLLSLEPLNLALASLSWSEGDTHRPAAWGSTPQGQTLLVLPQKPSKADDSAERVLNLAGRWVATGRRLSERVEFDLKFAPAVVTELELYLPAGWTLQASAGQTEGPLPVGESVEIPSIRSSGFKLWRIRLGSESACKLSVIRLKAELSARPLLLAESDTTYLVRERELQIESRYELEAVFAPVNQIALHVPRSVQVYAVSYGGDLNLNWRLKTEGRQKQVVIDFSDPLLGKSRPIRIQGLARVQANRAWPLPRLTCPEASLLRGDLHLTVESPLELRSYELKGFRQTAISVQPDQRETLSFSQTAGDRSAELTAYIGEPDFSWSAQLVSYLTTGTEEWQMRTETTWTAQSGSDYVAVCEVLPGWEILDVRRPAETSLPVISDWQLSPKGDRLTIEFLEALTPMQPKRVQILARRLPLTSEQTMPLASVKPIGARTVEQFLAVESQDGDIFAAEAGAGVTSWKAGNFPAFVQNSTLYPLVSSSDPGRDVQLFFSRSSEPEALLTLRRSVPPYDASVNVSVSLAHHQVHETLIFTVTPLESPIDRLTVLAPRFGKGWNWQLLPADGRVLPMNPPEAAGDEVSALDGNKIPWELQLPASQPAPFQIVANRHVEITPPYAVGLPHLPAARDFQGTVEVAAPGGTMLDVETRFTQEDRLPEPPEASQSELLRRWRYLSPDATFSVGHLPKDAEAPAVLGSLRLRSVINGYSETALHRARYELAASPEHIGFPFRLPGEARLIEVRLNEEIVAASRSEEGYFLHYLPPGQKNSIEVCYQTDWKLSGPTSVCRVPIPGTEVTLMGFNWQFAVSPNLALTGPPAGLALETSAASAHWSTRFFGPVGQGGENFFRPWNWEDWKSLLRAEPREPPAETGGEFFPAGWTVREARAPRAAESLPISVWNRDLVNPLVWVAFLASLTAGLALRLWGSPQMRPLGPAWLILTAAGAGLLPWPWAFVSGGCVAGALIAILFPRRFLVRSRPSADVIPLGSTASFRHHSVANTLLLIALGAMAFGYSPAQWLTAQEIPPAPEAVPDEGLTVRDFNVLVPVDDPRNPKTVSEVVYVEQALLERLRRSQPAKKTEEPYLISSARYEVDVSASGAVDLTADFRIIVLAPHRTVRVRLPIEHAFPGGPGSCEVDGTPHAMLPEQDFAGYILELAPQPSTGPAVAEKINKPIAVRAVRLRLHGRATMGTGSGRFQFGVPSVPATRMTATLPESYSSLQIIGAQGQILSKSSDQTLGGIIGATRKLELVWSQKPDALPEPIEQPPAVAALATIHPFWIEWQIRVKNVPATGTPSAFLMLPRNTLVKAVKTDRLESFRSRQDSGGTRLLLEFPEPVMTEFSAEIQCITPRTAANLTQARLPALDLFAGHPHGEAFDAEYHLGVGSTPELAVELPVPDPESAEGILIVPPDRFVSAFRMSTAETPGIRLPQFAWKILKPSELKLPVVPRVPSKRVWLHQEGQLTEREIQWNITAEVETSGAKAFRHVFQVPEGLLIDTVSVFEDEAERLVRWTRTGSRLELVLSDGTTGIQNINITGWVPFLPRKGNRAKLPLVQVEDAVLVSSRLRVLQSRNVNHLVEVTGIEELQALEEEGQFAYGNGVYLIAGVRLTDPARVPEVVIGGEIPEYRVEKAAVIEPAGSGQTRVTTFLRLLEESRQHLHIRLPAAMTREFRVESLAEPGWIVPYETLTNADNSLDLVFHSASQSRLGTLKIESLLETASAERGEQCDIQVIQGTVENAFLLISPDLQLQVTIPADRPESVSAESLPLWIHDALAFDEETSEFSLYRQPGSAWRLSPARSDDDGQSPEFVASSAVWLTEADTIIGQSVLEFPAESLQSLTWQWPEGTVLEGALLDGRKLSPVIDEEHHSLRLLLPARTELKPGSASRTLELYWSRKLADRLRRFGRVDLEIPRPEQVPLSEARLAVIPAAHTRLLPQEGLLPAETSFRPFEVHALAGLLPEDAGHWTVSLWTMDSRTENALLMALLVVFLGGIAHWGLRLRWGDWLNRHHAVACAGLGLVWWLCFKGSAVGFLVVLLAPMLALSRGQKPEADDEEPPEIIPSH